MTRILRIQYPARRLASLALLGFSTLLGICNEVTITRTNFVDRWITNQIEVKAPANHFVNEYHTNWVARYWTNVVDVYATNHLTRFMTNRIQVDQFRTNWVQAYQTNLKTLHLTNWTSVLVLRTNWVTQPVTNMVDLDLPGKGPESKKPSASARENSKLETLPPMQPAPVLPALAEPLELAANRVPRVLPNKQIEVKLIVHWTNDLAAPVQVQQWRVEREDGTILCFGQDQEFKRALPAGKYKVKVRAQREANGPLLAALGTLAVTPSEVVLQQKPSVKN